MSEVAWKGLVLQQHARLAKHEFILSFVSRDGRLSLSFLSSWAPACCGGDGAISDAIKIPTCKISDAD